MTLYSNQRFSEYSQSWKFVDENKNILLNFKTVTRQNNPEYGKIQNGYWNIPGERFYTMKKKKCLDDNGTESYLVLKMKQPVAIDLEYKVSIFTTKYALINEFNTKMNKLFSSRQCYIKPQEHFMPMNLDSISDESEYKIDDRQFYSQSYSIKVFAYIITENDYRVEEEPLKIGGNLGLNVAKRKKVKVELDEMPYQPVEIGKDGCGNIKYAYYQFGEKKYREIIDVSDIVCEEPEVLYYKPLSITATFLPCKTELETEKITIPDDINFIVTDYTLSHNVPSVSFEVNDEPVSSKISMDTPMILKRGDELRIKLNRRYFLNTDVILTLNGYSPNLVDTEFIDNIENECENDDIIE